MNDNNNNFDILSDDDEVINLLDVYVYPVFDSGYNNVANNPNSNEPDEHKDCFFCGYRFHPTPSHNTVDHMYLSCCGEKGGWLVHVICYRDYLRAQMEKLNTDAETKVTCPFCRNPDDSKKFSMNQFKCSLNGRKMTFPRVYNKALYPDEYSDEVSPFNREAMANLDHAAWVAAENRRGRDGNNNNVELVNRQREMRELREVAQSQAPPNLIHHFQGNLFEVVGQMIQSNFPNHDQLEQLRRVPNFHISRNHLLNGRYQLHGSATQIWDFLVRTNNNFEQYYRENLLGPDVGFDTPPASPMEPEEIEVPLVEEVIPDPVIQPQQFVPLRRPIHHNAAPPDLADELLGAIQNLGRRVPIAPPLDMGEGVLRAPIAPDYRPSNEYYERVSDTRSEIEIVHSGLNHVGDRDWLNRLMQRMSSTFSSVRRYMRIEEPVRPIVLANDLLLVREPRLLDREDPLAPPIRNFHNHPGRTVTPGFVYHNICELVEYNPISAFWGVIPDFEAKQFPIPTVVKRRNEQVRLPAGIVEQLAIVWAATFDNKNDENLSVVTEVCKGRLRTLNISPNEEYLAVAHAPLIAYRFHRDKEYEQNAVSRAYWQQRRYRYLYRHVLQLLKYGALFATGIYVGAKIYRQSRRVFGIQLGAFSAPPLVSEGRPLFPTDLAETIVESVNNRNILFDRVNHLYCKLLSLENGGQLVKIAAYAIFVAPVLEELVKPVLMKVFSKYGWFKRLVFPFYESLVNTDCSPEQLINYWLGPGLMHVGVSYLSIPAAMGVHMFWNASAIFYNLQTMSNIPCGALKYALLPISSLLVRAYRTRNAEPIVVAPKVGARKMGDPNSKPDKTRNCMLLYGMCVPGYEPVAFAPNFHNENIAVDKRVIGATLQPDTNELNACARFLITERKVLFPKLFRKRVVKPMPFNEYLRRSGASPAVKRILIQTRNKLKLSGIDEFSPLTPDQIKLWTTRKAFVKVENLCQQSPLGIKDKEPRLIQGAAPEFICLVGPWIAALQLCIKRDWGINNFIVFTSSLSALQLGNLFVSHPGMKGENDISAYDTSNSRLFMQTEVDFCALCGAPVAVLQLMYGNVNVRGWTSKGIKYSCPGTRKSGDPYTSVFNSMWNAVCHCYLYCKQMRCSLLELKNSSNLLMLVQGDDNALSIVGPVPDFQTGMATLGFEAKFIMRASHLDLEFCSNRIYPVEEGYVFGPKPGKVIQKLGFYINPPHVKQVSRESMVRGTAIGLIAACWHIEPLKMYLQRLLDLTKGHNSYKQPFEEWKMKYVKCTPTLATQSALYEQIGWSPQLREFFISSLNSTELGGDLSGMVTQFICDRDTTALKQF